MSFLFLLGVVLAVAGIGYSAKRLMKIFTCKAFAVGRISYLETHANTSRSRTIAESDYYFPVYEYEVDGEQFFVTSEEYSLNRNLFKLGTAGNVRYNPSNPKQAFVNKKLGITNGVILLIFGVVLMALG